MRNGIIRFTALYVFTVATLLILGALLPNVSVGLHALWASVVLTLAALFVKPMLRSMFRSGAARSSARRGRLAEKLVQYALVYAVELIIWILTVWLSGVSVRGFFWGYVIPPLVLLIGWVIYDRVDDRMREKAGAVYDSVRAKVSSPRASTPQTAPAPESEATSAGRRELNDGLTPEQRRMLDELG